ncbi:hypothetical protein SAMN05444287_2979 [Octadecabacter temperatus]|uniref:Uncharacterized protein n=1 Tax=Octadecabacter temperatus TaxID=1458307 RepID=A0A0K0Y8T6_9RHOB|nr:hypothetical protein OSB_28550 [Octadecabacter temperatus]SIO43344.1 hypothetical protein SAMN05444287_2979 [Octadecabacter temperatus]
MFSSISAFISKFRRSEDGAVTVDWVVLTAALVGLSIAILSQVATGAETASDKIARCSRIVGNQLLRDQSTDARSYEWRLARAQRNCGRL